ncbi:DNA (cytosine-5-)-methyltransferase N-terminal subunit [Mycoplasma sp. AC157]
MKKREIKIFEAFAGIGSQIKALNNIKNKMNITVKSMGLIEWFIDSIIAYDLINEKKESHTNKINLDKIKENLSKLKLSNDSKNLVSNRFFNKKSDEYLIQIYPFFEKFIKTAECSLSLSLWGDSFIL